MKSKFVRLLAVPVVALALVAGAARVLGAPDGIKALQTPEGGRIMYGQLDGQLTPPAALGQVLRRLHVLCGDRPQLGSVVQSRTGEVAAGFFTVVAKNQDGKQMAGLVMVYAPKSGPAVGFVLADQADRFPSTVNSMFARMQQDLSSAHTSQGGQGRSSGGSAAPGAHSQPASLQAAYLSDGTAGIGLPAGWTMVGGAKGDLSAKGPRGEMLRFGLTIPVTSNTRGAAPGQFLAIPYATASDGAALYKAVTTQIALKVRQQPPSIEITKVDDIPLQGGKNYLVYGNVSKNDGQGPDFVVAQMIVTQPQIAGTWQVTLFQIQGPAQVMAEESATLAEIFPSYRRDSKKIIIMVNQEIAQGIAQTNQFVQSVEGYMDQSDRFTAGFSDFLREKTVIRNTETGDHARTSDWLADRLIEANPQRYERVPVSEYIKGIDY